MNIILIFKTKPLLLDFINHNCKDFNNPIALKPLYCSFVTSIFDYNSTVWSPYTNGPTQTIESIQNHFLRLICNKYSIQHLPDSFYNPILSYLKLESLDLRRKDWIYVLFLNY